MPSSIAPASSPRPEPATYRRRERGRHRGTAAGNRSRHPVRPCLVPGGAGARAVCLCGEQASSRAPGGRGGPTSSLIVRPPAVYGPGDRATLPIFQQLGRGLLLAPATRAARFSLIHVADLARLLATLALRPSAAARQPLEPDDGRAGGYGWSDLAAMAGGATGSKDSHAAPAGQGAVAAGCRCRSLGAARRPAAAAQPRQAARAGPRRLGVPADAGGAGLAAGHGFCGGLCRHGSHGMLGPAGYSGTRWTGDGDAAR